MARVGTCDFALLALPFSIIQIDKPTDEQINEWHKKYTDELQRLFSAYKHIRPDYKSKELRITEK
jgi:hypothetical protein